jgi:hypothetical protein
VLFGTYQFRDPEEKKYAKLALIGDQTEFYVTESQGKSVMKSFSPIHTNYLKYNPNGSIPLIEITSDYTEITRELQLQYEKNLWYMGVCTLLAMLVMAAALWFFKQNKAMALQNVQDAYVGNIETLFQSVREQRHDFINHIQTIHAFLTLKHYDELQKYTNSLVGEIRVVNELINIKDPALIALIQAELTHIVFDYEFQHMDRLKLSPIKATDVIKILSNLIDNAFDAVAELDRTLRHVKITGHVLNNQLEFTVSNERTCHC